MLGLSTLQAGVVVAGVAFAAGGMTGWKLASMAAQADRIAAYEAHQEALSQAVTKWQSKADQNQKRAETLEKQLVTLRDRPPEIKTIKVREYVREENIACPVSADGVQLLTASVSAVNAARSTR